MATYPQDLKNYLQYIFKIVHPSAKPDAEKQLKDLIHNVYVEGRLNTMDWMHTPIPLARVKDNALSVLSYEETTWPIHAFYKNIIERASHDQVPSSSSSSSTNGPPAYIPPFRRAKDATPIASPQSASPLIGSAPRTPELSELGLSSPDHKEKRMRRFQSRSEAPVQSSVQQPSSWKVGGGNALALDALGNVDWDAHKVVGTATNIEKPFLRITSIPDPSSVRPPAILDKALRHIKDKYTQDKNYSFACDQLKSIRQDLMIQGVKSPLTLNAYESHARLALANGDLGEFNQCQSQLKDLYRNLKSPNENEFLMYRILYLLYSRSDGDLDEQLASLTPAQRADPFVAYALDVRHACVFTNYHRFFKLAAVKLGNSEALLNLLVNPLRFTALADISKAYRPLDLSLLVATLGFESTSDAKSFLADNNLAFYSSENVLDAKALLSGLSANMRRFLRVDIKGQV